MTTSWADVQHAIKAAVVSVAGAAPGAVVWNDEQRPGAKVLLILDLLYLDAIQDREDVDVETDPSSPTWTLSTLYYIRVQVRAESVFTAAGADALFALERVRAGLRRPDLALDAGVVVQYDDQTYVHHLRAIADGRTISSYSFEIGFRAVLDYPIADPSDIAAAPNMTEVDIGATVGDETERDSIVPRP